ncbi:MAG: DNA polymerase III subunit delta [Kiloniellales bacterium]
MKIGPQRVEGFLGRPDPEVRVVLLYGADQGLIRERAERLARTVVDDLADPFRVSVIAGPALSEDPGRLADEAAALSMTGGRRVVRLREAGDRHADFLVAFLEAPVGDALIVVEADELGPRSRLRRLFEGARNAAAIGCYPDEGGELMRVIEEILAACGMTATPDAIGFLAEHLGGDRQVTRREIEKLALYMGDGGHARIEDALACIGDAALVSLDELVFAAADGDLPALDQAMKRVWDQAASPITVLRAMARHLQRLHLAAAKRAQGMAAKAAMQALRPPVFWKQERRFAGQLDRWTGEVLAGAIGRTLAAEIACKQTGAPAQLICHRTLLQIAHAARAARPRAVLPA